METAAGHQKLFWLTDWCHS